MNFIPVTLVQEGGDVFAVFEDSRVKIPEGKIKKLKDRFLYRQGSNYGRSSEDLHDEEIFLQSAVDSTVKAYVSSGADGFRNLPLSECRWQQYYCQG